MKLGNWNVEITKQQPQVIATAMADIAEKLIGAEYEFIAYLGSQVVKGTNHAVLAKQTILSGRDTENIVLLIFNEKPGDVKATLSSIERVVEGGMPMGGTQIDVQDILAAPKAKEVWDMAFESFVGSEVDPLMLLATQIVNGVNWIFLAKSTAIALEGDEKLVLVTVNSVAKKVSFVDLLTSRHENSLGYSFTW